MGYQTTFDGEFKISPPLKQEHCRYLELFAGTRRMKREVEVTGKRPDPVREAVGLPVGNDGCYFVGAEGLRGQEDMYDYAKLGIVQYNYPPNGQPSLYCQWEPARDGTVLKWDGVEKFSSYVAWLAYLVEHFLGPWGYVLDGTVKWQGERPEDFGLIVVKKSVIIALAGV